MRLERLQLANFRNYTQLDLTFEKDLTVLAGSNAQGKTNILEAIFLLSLAKSHRTNRDQEMIQWGSDQAVIEGHIRKNNYEFPLEVILHNRGKTVKHNHVLQDRLSHFVGKLNVILFAPEDLQVIKGSPGQRRRFLDAELGQSNPIYLQELLEYQRILKTRNRYLKDYGFSSKFDSVYYDILTDQLIEKALKIIEFRLRFVDQLNQLASEIHYELSDHQETLLTSYQPSTRRLNYQQWDQVADQMKALFHEQLDQEKRQGHTLYGPHRDDLSFDLNDNPVGQFGSQGQQRTVILSIKLAEIELLAQATGEYPVLLLDDVLSELDDRRQNILMQKIEGKVQTFLTTASLKSIHLDELHAAEVYKISSGHVIRES